MQSGAEFFLACNGLILLHAVFNFCEFCAFFAASSKLEGGRSMHDPNYVKIATGLFIMLNPLCAHSGVF